MRFSDHFFTYHLEKPSYSSCANCFSIFIALILNIGAFVGTLVILAGKDNSIKFIAGIIIPAVNIISFILYKIFQYCFDNEIRIDCIYSKDFDRVFIGIVKYNNKKYINTFEFQMNNISRFILEKVGNSYNSNFNLKVVFKNKKTANLLYKE